MDSMKDVFRSSVLVTEFDKRLKKARGHIDRNVVEITIKRKAIVRKPLMIKITLCYTPIPTTDALIVNSNRNVTVANSVLGLIYRASMGLTKKFLQRISRSNYVPQFTVYTN